MDTTTASPLYDKVSDRRRHGFVHTAGKNFMMGTAFGSALYGIAGFGTSPVGGRLAGAASATITKAPLVGGFIGAYSALYWVFEGAVAHACRKDDAWNSIAASAAAFSLLHAPLGGHNAAVAALIGATVGPIIPH